MQVIETFELFTRVSCNHSSDINTIHRTFASGLQLTSEVPDFQVTNEPVLEYLSGSKERAELEKALAELKDTCTEVPIIIDGKEIKSDLVKYQVAPFDHSRKVAKFYWATPVSTL